MGAKSSSDASAFAVLAFLPTSDLVTSSSTSQAYGPSNGVYWYYFPRQSVGFASSSSISLSSADVSDSFSSDSDSGTCSSRLSWHLDQSAGGWRAGCATSLNSDPTWRKMMFSCPGSHKHQQSTCLDCVPGKYSSLSSATACLYCPVLTTSENGSSSCECIIGHMANTNGSCTPCEKGKFKNMIGNGSCIACGTGKYVGTTGSTVCSDCMAGTFSLVNGSISNEACVPCPADHFCLLGQGDARKCPPHSTTPSGRWFCSCIAEHRAVVPDYALGAGDSSNNGEESWRSSFSGDIAYVSSPVAQTNYFTRYGRVRIIDGDGSHDSNGWSIFNFGAANSNGDYDDETFFGGENVYSGGNGGDNSVKVGGVWGFSCRRGWTLLYLLNLGDSAANHRNGMWFNASGTNMTSGKRDAYDTLPVDFIGFSVHATNNETDLLDGRSFRVWANEATCAPAGRYSNISDTAAVFLSRDRMHCSLGLTWRQLLALKQNKETQDRISTGGLGKKLVHEVKVW
eukprot:CAMPEP_0173125524 /NCGR_PEP_ID=MMETSP1102-20130122/56473_1 /TAXON_ID=49646 /ORGANISM="Geminigera sp., Strain Caron Lab Isolate" /LENGTH=510 /DNA_ID=CAMNT_0014034419 /DNA_START=218 /DNA_END=1748 /DNA_ORIENTATION=+